MARYDELTESRILLERVRVVGPMEEGQPVLRELHDAGFQTVRSGPYTDREMHPMADVKRFLFIAEREVGNERPE